MNIDRLDQYYNIIGNPDKEQLIENKKITVALELFKKILEDFSHHDFTLQDIKDSYNVQISKKKYAQRYGKHHLDTLVKMGLLIYDKKNKTYSVDHASPEVARIVEGEYNN